ncbi:MAG: aminotransferase class V-fold PLP-dependent enzyme, partial [Micromonosporaceae bacterium]|nr:aminotransferase class V-fold PLP-dependent enzyme [Micromonosporaceae bacterium]
MEANPARFQRRGLAERLAHTRSHLSRLVGVEPASCAFVPDARTAAAMVLQALNLREGDEIVTTDHGHPEMAAVVDAACRVTRARHNVAVVPLAAEGGEVVAAVRRVLTDRTRLVVVDQVTARTARIFPVRDLA